MSGDMHMHAANYYNDLSINYKTHATYLKDTKNTLKALGPYTATLSINLINLQSTQSIGIAMVLSFPILGIDIPGLQYYVPSC